MYDFWRFTPVSLDSFKLVEGHFDYFLVSLSFLISSFAAYALLVVLDRAWKSKSKKSIKLWEVFGSVVFGLGVWAMHFTGMLAFMLPIPMHFNVSLTVLSVITPMFSAYLSIRILSKEVFSFINIHLSALFLALGIGSMHFIGMEAMKIEGVMSYTPILFILSLFIAYILATISIYLIRSFNTTRHFFSKLVSAVIMGNAVAWMHYVAMSAVSFYIPSNEVLKVHSMHGNSISFSLAITAIVFIIVATTILCALIDDKLQKAQITIEESVIREKDIIDNMADGLLTISSLGIVESINSSGLSMFGYNKENIIGRDFRSLMNSDKIQGLIGNTLEESLGKSLKLSFTAQGIKEKGSTFPIEVNFSKILISSKNESIFNCVARDITSRVKLEEQLRQSQKLESIGQLSAGIAHEINTPTQYVSDNTMFLNNAFESCIRIINTTEKLISKDISEITQKDLEDIKTIFSEEDMEFVLSEIPLAINQSIEGLERIKKIIGAMKSFSHSNQGQMNEVDVTEAIDSTITISRSEWRYIATLHTEYQENLPKIKCLRDEMNQVILNFIVNAAHAIEERYGKDNDVLGKINIAVSLDDSHIKISISDNGIGMLKEVKDRIFDPFFTTKDVGKGTGQGLSMAYSVIVDKHNGFITTESERNRGTTFNIFLPAT